MKRIVCLFLFFSLSSCFTLDLFGIPYQVDFNEKTNKWLWVDMLPSQVKTDGDVIFKGTLKKGGYFNVYLDQSLLNDGTYYYNQLFKSYGWTRMGGGIQQASIYAKRPKLGALHISVKRGVAIYMYPDSEWQIFRISVIK